LLVQHYDRLRQEVGATDAVHYLALADRFLGGPIGPTVRECMRRSDGATIRWDYVSQEFGILNASGYIVTYYIAMPKWHGFPSNRTYFQYECGR